MNDDTDDTLPPADAAALYAAEKPRRRMREPVKDELRRQLEVARAETIYWREKAEAAPFWRVLAVGLLSGILVGAGCFR